MKWFDYYLQSVRFKMAAKHIEANNNLLDIGCFNGELFQLLQEKNISGTGVDPLADIGKVKLPDDVVLQRVHFPTDKVKGLKFNYITALAVFEHISPDEQHNFLEECYRLLSEEGKMIITVPSSMVDNILRTLKFLHLIDAMSLEQHHGFKPVEVIPVFRKAGFILLRHTRFELGLNNLFVFKKSPIE